MTIVDLLLRLQALDITVRADGDRLKIGAPDGVLTDDLRAELTARKPELLAFLRDGAPAGTDRIAALPHHDGVPVSFTQQRFWFFHNLVPDTAAYHVCFGLRLRGRLDRAVLSRALDEIVSRHALLRTVFTAPDGEPVQSVLAAGPVPLPLVDLTGVPEAMRTVRFEQLARGVTNAPFDLTAQPPLRASLFALAADDHALIVAMHHIASDAWSVTTFLRELGTLYDAFASGAVQPLPALAVQYADFASWQREQLARPELKSQREYWETQLAGAPTLNLPSDRPRPAFQTFRGGRTTFTIPRRLADALDALARQERGTLFMALLAGFYGLLHRYSGQTDLVVGTAIAGRSRPETEPLIGPFINTLALRTDVSGDPTFRTVIGRARETALGAYASQDLPFEKVVDALKLDRVLSRNPLFQVMLALQNVPAPPRALRDLEISAFDIDRETTVSDLELIFWPTAAGLEGYVRYSADLFDGATVDRMLRHFEGLLESAVAAPDRRLSELPLMTEAEEAQLARWNRTHADYPRTVPVPVAFAQQAARTPDAIAVVWRGHRLTYRDLDGRANALAHRLIARGVGIEDRVAILLDRSADFIVAALAAMKAGAAYLPIEPATPVDRLAYMLADAGVRVAVTDADGAARVRQCGASELLVGDAGEQRPDAPAVALRSANLAYVIYTSGSTGRPKGVAVSHDGLMNLVAWHQRVYGVTAQDRSALVAGLAFDASVWELWPYLLSGAAMHVPEDETRGSAALLLDWLAESAITICFAPTPLAEAMLETPLPTHLSLRALLTGGDKLHRVPRGLPFRVYNNYGPTENTVVATWIEVPPTDVAPAIGHPVDNARAHVLDRGMRAVPVGVPGELYLAGDSLARGYLGRPDMTADRFVPDPFAVTPGGRLYRTGDLVRRLAGGELDFLGRLDDQVKVRGFRIELGEIETVLGQHASVREAVVVARDGRAGNRRLLAYVTPRDGAVDVAELKRHLKDTLPDYMVPSAIVALDALPLTPNGKVDRQALPEPAANAVSPDGPEQAPARNDTERTLAEIWARVLRLASVGVHDNFFEAGGDSILALQVIAAARQHGLRLTPRQIFEHPTVAELSQVAATDRPAAPAVPGAPGVDDEPVGDVPLTPIQRWFLEQDVPEPSHFNQSAMLMARARIDAAHLVEAFEQLVEHHDALRLRFTAPAGNDRRAWRQTYATDAVAVAVETVDLAAVPAAQRLLAIEDAADRIQAGLDIVNGPVARAAIFECGDEPQRLLITIHHLVVDTVSWRVLLADLQQIYADVAAGRASTLPEKSSSFKAWAARLEAHASAGLDPAEIAFWRNGARARCFVPFDTPGGANVTASEQTVRATVPAEETEALLREVPKTYGMQVQEVLLAAVVRALAAWTRQRRVVLDLESHGRDALFDDLNLSRTVGWFTALYPLAIDLGPSDDPADALKRVKEQSRQVPNRGIGYGILRYLRPDAAAATALDAATPAPVSFNYLGQFAADDAAAPLAPAPESCGAINSPRLPRAHALDISAHIAGGQLRLAVHYSANLHRRSTIDTLARGIVNGLSELVRHCRQSGPLLTPSDFPEANVSQDDLDRLLARIGEAGSYS